MVVQVPFGGLKVVRTKSVSEPVKLVGQWLDWSNQSDRIKTFYHNLLKYEKFVIHIIKV